MRRCGGLVVAAIVVALALLNFAVSGPPTAVTVFRCAFSLAAVAIVLFSRTAFVKRALVAVALEALGGVCAFALVDVPFIERHRGQIGSYAQTLYCRFEPRAAQR